MDGKFSSAFIKCQKTRRLQKQLSVTIRLGVSHTCILTEKVQKFMHRAQFDADKFIFTFTFPKCLTSQDGQHLKQLFTPKANSETQTLKYKQRK